MFCRKCGAQMGGDEKFCPNCGTPVDAPPVVPTPTPVPPTPAPAPVAPVERNPLDLRSHPLFLVAVICASVVALFQIVGMFTSMGALSAMGDSLDMLNMGEMTDMLSGVGAVSILISLGALAITAVVLTGLWMTYASGLGEGDGPMLNRGLKLVRGGLMAEMIYMIVLLSILAICFLMFAIMGGSMSGGSYYDYFDYDYYDYKAATGAITAAGIIGLLLVAGIGTLMVIFYVKARQGVSCALTTAETGRITGAVSMFVPVMCFVVAGLGLLGVLMSGSAMGVLAVLNTLVDGAAYILFGIVAVQYRSRALAA